MVKKITYNGTEDFVINGKSFAQTFMQKLNNLEYSQQNEVNQLCKKYFCHFGDTSILNKPFHCDIARNIFIGERVFINYNCTMLDMTNIEIGDDVLIGPNVILSTATHSLSASERVIGNGYALPIKICNNVWIGAGAIICPGVTLNEGCVVGAGSVVTKDVDKYVIVAGAPAKAIGKSRK